MSQNIFGYAHQSKCKRMPAKCKYYQEVLCIVVSQGKVCGMLITLHRDAGKIDNWRHFSQIIDYF